MLESLKDLLTEATWDCADTGIQLQAMDNSHVSLVSVNLRADGFDKFRFVLILELCMNEKWTETFSPTHQSGTILLKAVSS